MKSNTPAGRPPIAHYTVPPDLFQAIASYLTMKPYKEVNVLLAGIEADCKAVFTNPDATAADGIEEHPGRILRAVDNGDPGEATKPTIAELEQDIDNGEAGHIEPDGSYEKPFPDADLADLDSAAVAALEEIPDDAKPADPPATRRRPVVADPDEITEDSTDYMIDPTDGHAVETGAFDDDTLAKSEKEDNNHGRD